MRATGDDDGILKIVQKESDHWETARAPNEATFTLRAALPAANRGPGGGEAYYAPPAPLSLPLGAGALPEGVEKALATMPQGERATFIVPASLMAPPAADGGAAGGGGLGAIKAGGGAAAAAPRRACVVPAAPEGAAQVELQIELLELVQVGARGH